jgi:hypothetical protein
VELAKAAEGRLVDTLVHELGDIKMNYKLTAAAPTLK